MSEVERGARRHIFAINHDPDLLALLGHLFRREKYNVTITNFVPGTFDQIAALIPSLLVVDLVIYERAGWELLERLRAEARTRGIPVIILSTNPHLLERARVNHDRFGGDAFLEKPFDLNDMMGAVHRLIGSAGPPEQDVARGTH